jgi:hypothetical protein
MQKPALRFLDLSSRHFGLTERVAGGYAEAACVCLDRHHTPPQDFHIVDDGLFNGEARAEWPPSSTRVKVAWANRDDATRDGAYGIALATIELTRGLVAVGRAETRTGADYYLGPADQLGSNDEPVKDYERTFRLEVSGIDNCTPNLIQARLRKKLEQARNGESNLPAIAAVVGFSTADVLADEVDEP